MSLSELKQPRSCSLGISVIYTILVPSRTRLIFAVARKDVIVYHFISLSDEKVTLYSGNKGFLIVEKTWQTEQSDIVYFGGLSLWIICFLIPFVIVTVTLHFLIPLLFPVYCSNLSLL